MTGSDSFLEEDLKWKVDDIEMNGTLTFPENGKSSSCVLFVAGSGPTDRNWCSPLLPGSNGSGKLLAEGLSKLGFSCLRFDKRASGPDVMKNLPLFAGKVTMKFHVDELSGAIQALLERGIVKENGLFALTSSEGAIHALHYQLEGRLPGFSGMILTGVPGRSIADVVRQQVEEMVCNEKGPENILQMYDRAIANFTEGKQVTLDPSIPQNIAMLIKSLTSPANLPFSRELWMTDPAILVSMISIPALLIIGKKDMQVDWQTDGARLESMVKGKANFEIAYPENANHVLKLESKNRNELTPDYIGRSYNSADSVLDGEVLSMISDWLRRHSNMH